MPNKHTLLSLVDSLIDLNALTSALRDGDEARIAAPVGAAAFLLHRLAEERACVYIARDELEAEEVYESLRSVADEGLFFPDVDVVPFSNVLPSSDKLSDRVQTLYRLRQGGRRIVVTTLESFMRKLPPVHSLEKSTLSVGVNDTLDRESLSDKLSKMGYTREHKASEPGSFSVRGDIVDIYPPNSHEAVRVNLFGDMVESVRFYHPVTQVSTGDAGRFEIIPASEFAFLKDRNPEGMEDLLQETHAHSHFLKFHEGFSDLLDYAGGDALLYYREEVLSVEEDIANRYARHHRADLPEEDLLQSFETLLERHTDVKRVVVGPILGFHPEHPPVLSLAPPPEFGEGFSRFVSDLEAVYLSAGWRIFILVEYEDLAKRLAKILAPHNPRLMELGADVNPDDRLCIVTCGFEHGFAVEGERGRMLLLTESDISGKKRLFRKRIRQIDTIFEDIEDIKEGEHVVHLNYGIGVFKRIERLNVLGKEKDYILLEYAGGEKLFVPLEQSNLIGKYVGGVTKKPVLDSLGGKSWQKKREKIQASIEEFAGKLVTIYAKRSMLAGHSFAADTVWQKEFEDKFEFIETPDQVKVMEEIKKDMESPRPMERLLCGDVGFGKTEIAMRSAFKAVMDGKQVAVVAPTTVLTEQHWNTFRRRTEGFPVRIESVSRFTEAPELRKILRDLKENKVDILIGTHKLFSEKVIFKNLGLVIVDEEHKFGVEHKERLKERYPTVDFLSLSATPIPRTLNMALSTLRDISLLQTPPDMRIPVKTIVSEFNMEVVEYAIRQELQRGGQVYFVHNTIKRLPEYAYLIEKLVPEAKVSIGHGQMEEHELDRAFMGFVNGETNVFVCTTIIDSGLDIPNANTIVVSDAQRFGLSQLYQLKGRVGRAKREGHAYFFFPAERTITETAQKRLFVLSEYTDLGAGFNIALKDLEIRGAGNVLGREQHGNIIAVGYDMYMRLLREEIDKQKGTYREAVETMIDLRYDAFIPPEYIEDSATKMEIYKKILSVKSEEDIRRLSEELHDRFGAIPSEVSTLFEIGRLKIRASALGIESIIEKGELIEIGFSKFSRVDPMKVMEAMQGGKHEIVIKPNQPRKMFYKGFDSNIAIKVKRMVAFMNDVQE
jgi:transcription-repair coupling factor (superfamily II helicase)